MQRRRFGLRPLLSVALTVFASCHSNGSSTPSELAPPSTVHLGDAFTIVNESGVSVCVTGVLLEGADPAWPLYHGILAGKLDVSRPPPPLKGRVLRLRFAASGPQFDLYSKRLRDGGNVVEGPQGAPSEKVAREIVAKLPPGIAAPMAVFTEWQPQAGRTPTADELAGMPEIEPAPGVAEYVLGSAERSRALGPLEVHVIRHGDGLAATTTSTLRMKVDATGFDVEDRGDSFAVYRTDADVPLLVQRCEAGARPCLHPLMSPDLDGALTEFMPDHHHHQTGVFFGLPEVNGRSYFHKTREGLFKRENVFTREGNWTLSSRNGPKLRWSVADDWMGERGELLTETQQWELADQGSGYVLDLQWSALAHEDVNVGEFDYGGLFIRMPWRERAGGHAINSEGLTDAACEGGRARWVDVGLVPPGRKDGKAAHIALLDHPKNDGHPTPYRVDDQLGFGPCRARLGGYKIPRGKTTTARYRLVVYLGDFDRNRVETQWKEFAATQ